MIPAMAMDDIVKWVATVLLGAGIAMTWDASIGLKPLTYHIEQCRGLECVDFIEIGTTQETSYVAKDLLTSTHYRYRIRACDPNGECSRYSDIKGARTDSESINLRIRIGGSWP
jgi:hypothetical protein